MNGTIDMKVIGITGGTGAGKSSVCDELKRCGAEIVDCDKIARMVVEKGKPALKELVGVFGEEILLCDGTLDRKKVGSIVFSDKEKLDALNSITHKYIFDEMRRQMLESCCDVVVLDVPLLFQSDFPFECDVTVAIIADEETRIQRIMKRDGIERTSAVARMSNQLTNAEYKALADLCFENNGDINEIKNFVKTIYNY